ncbi:MAG TPA: peptidoglycan bridge formation glycyltransferase FemA/FemB family protein [Spirochaetia bacterium]|nr:peptidoglycan bridge formation glycyltransferase FemA/FemB family protein [Spirochaetia bacterium]
MRGKTAADFGLLVLSRALIGQFVIAYVPFGPTFDTSCSRGEFLSSLGGALRAHLPAGTAFIRFDLPWEKTGEKPAWSGTGPRVVKCPSDIQPPNTVVVDISGPLDGVLGSMKPKTRYNIRLAEKKGVTVREGGEGCFDAWYSMYQGTSRRDRIAIHSSSYYRGLLGAGSEYPGASPTVTLFTAWHEGDMLAGNICVFWKKRGIYLTGASSNEKRNLMPTYALQWEAIRRAKEAGCTEYDLYGIPREPDPSHPMFGLYQFKTGFSDRTIERWGTWDVPYMPMLCRAYRVAEETRLFYYRSVKKQLRRR